MHDVLRLTDTITRLTCVENRRGVRRALCVSILWLAATGSGFAHEIGTTRVVPRFGHDDTYRIEVITDAGALLARLEAATQTQGERPTPSSAYRAGFDRLCTEVPRHLTLMFDGQVSHPTASCFVDQGEATPASPFNVPGVTVTLTG